MIGLAKQDGRYVRVYDENGKYMFNIPGELQGFTSTTVAIKDNISIRVYDENGRFKYNK